MERETQNFKKKTTGQADLEMSFLVIENLERCEYVNVKQRYRVIFSHMFMNEYRCGDITG